jgi:PAS domain S-box-containing protein
MDDLLRTSDKSLFKLIDNANVFFLYLDEHGNISTCNKKIEEITGRLRDDIIGKNCFSILYHDGNTAIKQQMFKAVMEDSITYKRLNNFEGNIEDVNGHERLISWSITPILAESKELEGILLIGNDITEAKERESSLKKIDEMLKNIFSSIKEYSLYVTNLDGNITYYGMGSEVMFGWQKNEIIFKHVGILHTKEDATSRLPFILDQVKKAGHYDLEINLIKKDGYIFPVMLTVNQFLDTEGKISGYIFMAKDITEKRKLEYQIFQAEKLSAMGQLVAGMAHEINNPLFVISGRTEMMLGRKRISSEFKEDLGTIKEQTDRIRKLVDRLLKFSRKSAPKLETININDSVKSVLPFLSYHKLPSAKIRIVKRYEKKPLLVKGDLNQMQEVLLNLFINAYQSMPQGGTLTITQQAAYLISSQKSG